MTEKKLLYDLSDLCLSLLAYRATPLPWCNLSPTQLLMEKQIRTGVPQVKERLAPHDFNGFRARVSKQKRDFDHRHRIKELPKLPYWMILRWW